MMIAARPRQPRASRIDPPFARRRSRASLVEYQGAGLHCQHFATRPSAVAAGQRLHQGRDRRVRCRGSVSALGAGRSRAALDEVAFRVGDDIAGLIAACSMATMTPERLRPGHEERPRSMASRPRLSRWAARQPQLAASHPVDAEIRALSSLFARSDHPARATISPSADHEVTCGPDRLAC